MTNNLIHYQKTPNLDILDLIENNVSFTVLHQILQTKCNDIFTNSKSIIIGYSAPPNPVWVWCEDVNNKSDISIIAEYLKKYFPLEKNYTFNLEYETLEKLKEHDEYFKSTSIKMRLLSYKLISLMEINYNCDGYLEMIKIEDFDNMIQLYKDAYYEITKTEITFDESKEKILNHINTKQLYAWKNSNGEIVAFCTRKINGKYSRISSVYTIPSKRRLGYAINLVYAVSKDLVSKNIIPVLYTDGNYTASNECYKKIGFEQFGKLCTIKKSDV